MERKHATGVNDAMSYMTREQVPIINALADSYTSCDRWFSSVLGPTLPNRMYWHAGSSNGARANDEVYGGAYQGLASLYHRLDDRGVDWAYYFGDVPVLAVLEDLEIEGRIRRFQGEFLADAKAGNLPPVVYVDPAFSVNDDHPPHHPMFGQQLMAAVHTALASSPQWNRTLLVITYDENGGFYDHVAPPKSADDFAADGFDQLGFRVPTVVCGPYAKPGYVSSVVYDHTSPLKHMQSVFGLESLSARADAANDLADCIDEERLLRGAPRPAASLPAIEIDESAIPDKCYGGAAERTGTYDHDILEWADANRARLGKWDRRAHVRDYVFEIADFLDQHGGGRIRLGR